MTSSLTAVVTEKDELLLRNAQLSQDVESLKRRHNDAQQDLSTELQQKNNSIAGLEQVLQEMTSELSAAKHRVGIRSARSLSGASKMIHLHAMFGCLC